MRYIIPHEGHIASLRGPHCRANVLLLPPESPGPSSKASDVSPQPLSEPYLRGPGIPLFSEQTSAASSERAHALRGLPRNDHAANRISVCSTALETPQRSIQSCHLLTPASVLSFDASGHRAPSPGHPAGAGRFLFSPPPILKFRSSREGPVPQPALCLSWFPPIFSFSCASSDETGASISLGHPRSDEGRYDRGPNPSITRTAPMAKTAGARRRRRSLKTAIRCWGMAHAVRGAAVRRIEPSISLPPSRRPRRAQGRDRAPSRPTHGQADLRQHHRCAGEERRCSRASGRCSST